MSSALQLFSIIGVGTQLINVGPIMSHISEIGLVALFWRTGHLQPEMIPNDATSDRCCAQSKKYHIIPPFRSNILKICIWVHHPLISSDRKSALCSDCKVVLTHSFCEDSPVLAFVPSTCLSVLFNSFQYPETTPCLPSYLLRGE